MSTLLFSYSGDSRELRKIITSLLKSGNALKVNKFNYVQSFELKEGAIKKSEIKYIVVYTDDESKLLDFLCKNFPLIERIKLN